MGSTLKQLAMLEQADWLDQDLDNWLKWDCVVLTMCEKRMLVTHWFGEAYQKFMSMKYFKLRIAAFECSGCVVDIHGQGD